MLRGRKEAERCEDDPGWKQLLPYIVAVDDAGNIYCYTRGKAGGEGRLHGALSIGLGGHVDIAPATSDLHTLLVAEGNRELAEEAGLPPAELNFVGLICDPTNAVGLVHLGLLAIRRIGNDERALMLGEPGIVEKGEFMSIDDLLSPEVHVRLENWSRCALQHIDAAMRTMPVACFSKDTSAMEVGVYS